MSDPKQCQWCLTTKPPGAGRWRQGHWVCYSCFPNEAGNLAKSRKCDICNQKESKGTLVTGLFYCFRCAGSESYKVKHPHKNKKKTKWVIENPLPKGAQQKKKEKRKQACAPVEVKIEKWKVLIEDISTGDL